MIVTSFFSLEVLNVQKIVQKLSLRIGRSIAMAVKLVNSVLNSQSLEKSTSSGQIIAQVGWRFFAIKRGGQ